MRANRRTGVRSRPHRRHGADISGYRARQVRPADFTRFTHIVALDAENLAALRAHAAYAVPRQRSACCSTMCADGMARQWPTPITATSPDLRPPGPTCNKVRRRPRGGLLLKATMSSLADAGARLLGSLVAASSERLAGRRSFLRDDGAIARWPTGCGEVGICPAHRGSYAAGVGGSRREGAGRCSRWTTKPWCWNRSRVVAGLDRAWSGAWPGSLARQHQATGSSLWLGRKLRVRNRSPSRTDGTESWPEFLCAATAC